MKIQFTARHFKASSELKDYLQDEVDRLAKFYDRITSCRVVLDAEHKSRLMAEITLSARGKTLVAKAVAGQMPKAVMEAIDRIETRLKKFTSKKHDHRPAGDKGVAKPPREEEEF